MKLLSCLALAALLSQANAFLGSEDRFMKKYAMMKIYESCFGEGVVRQIRKEMKLASTKCASLNAVPEHHTPSTPPPEEKPADDAIHDSVYQTQPNFDAEKLHQAILAFKPQNIMPQPSYRPYGGIGPASYYTPQLTNPAFSAPMFYPGFQPIQFTPYTFPMMGQQYLGNRIARGMDFNSQFDNLPSRVHGKLRNVSCVMQELGYLDENFEPNYPKINERISNLPVNEELRRDMQEGVTFCQQFSQCVPEVKKDVLLSRELMRPMFFFKCYKHKKLEACIMKDLRKKFGTVEDGDDDLEDEELEMRRQGKDMKLSSSSKDVDELAATVYEFLYSGDGGLDVDGLF